MKTIHYRGGVIVFRIPACWKEEYSDRDGGTFYDDVPDSGTLRLSVITASKRENGSFNESAEALLSRCPEVKGGAEPLPDGNAIAHHLQHTEEEGIPIILYRWLIANVIPPRHFRIAAFTYTIRRAQQQEEPVTRMLKILDREIRAASFSTELGVADSRDSSASN
jgi:hypothetical protein